MRSVRELCDYGADRLRQAVGSAADNPRREAQLLLETVTGLDRAELVKRRDDEIPEDEAAEFVSLLEERRAGVPFQLLAGRAAFHELDLRVESGVFIPRPETEVLVERVKDEVWARYQAAPGSDRAGAPVRMLDLCTGTGAIAVATAAAIIDRLLDRAEARKAAAGEGGGTPEVQMPTPEFYAGDWNPQAVRLARRNAEEQGVDVDVRRSDLFSAFADLEGRVDVLVSNPPYIEPDSELPPEVQHDPPEALYDPAGGTGFHERIARRGRDFLRAGGVLWLEMGETQGEEVATILRREGYGEVDVVSDLTGRNRFVVGVATGGVVPSMRSS